MRRGSARRRGSASLRYADAGARVFSRFLFSGAFDVELDGQGRVVLPAGLREFAGLKSDAVVVGARDHIELWEPDALGSATAPRWTPEVFAAAHADLGI